MRHVPLEFKLLTLFEAAGKPELSKDEELVDVLGGLLHQYMTTKRGKFE